MSLSTAEDDTNRRSEPGDAVPLAARSRAEPVTLVSEVRLQGFTLRHLGPDADPKQVRFRYENLYPEYAVDCIAFQWAAYSEAIDVGVEMAGRHPVNLENSYGVRMRNLKIDGAWNKGEGGAGYVRFARSYRSSLESSAIRNIRHLAFQWSAAYNEVRDCYIAVDINFHGGFSHHNLVTNSTLRLPAEHPWPPVVETPVTAAWAPPDGEGNQVLAARFDEPGGEGEADQPPAQDSEHRAEVPTRRPKNPAAEKPRARPL